MPGALTGAALTALILQCGGPAAPVDTLARIVMTESGGDPGAVHLNANGSRDYGLGQINSSNLSWLGLTPETALDPCRNIAAAADLLRSLSRYNTGTPTAGLLNGYVAKVLAQRAPDGLPPLPSQPPPTPPPINAWDVFAPASGAQFVFSKGTLDAQ